MRISDWSSDVCSSDLGLRLARLHPALQRGRSPIRDQERQDRPRRRAQGRGVEEVEGLTAAPTNHQSRLLLHRMPAELVAHRRSEEHTSELQSLMRISYAVFCLQQKKNKQDTLTTKNYHLGNQNLQL